MFLELPMLENGRLMRAASAVKMAGLALPLGVMVVLPQPARADAVIDWSLRAGRAAVAACLFQSANGPAESRMYAMAHVAIHDALNAIERHSRPYAFDAQVNAPASLDAAAAAAARDTLVSVIGQLQESPACIAEGIASVEVDYAAALAAIPDGPDKTLGIQVGQAAAAAILLLRANDGSDTLLLDTGYPQGTEPGEYRFVPGFDFTFAPGWADVTPFVLQSGSQFRAGPPYGVHTRKYAADFEEVKSRGGDGVSMPTERTDEQTEIGFFWIESSPLAWNRLARSVSEQVGLDLWENARLFGLLNLAMADGYIGSWETKYYYNYWRPETAIHAADTDGNPATTADPLWRPALGFTYPIPDHDSAHAVEGGAAAEVLKQVFGTDHISFSACSLSLPDGSRCTDPAPVFRSFASFSQAADENAESRIFIGIHFRRAVEEGVKHGRKIGQRAVNLFLKPVH